MHVIIGQAHALARAERRERVEQGRLEQAEVARAIWIGRVRSRSRARMARLHRSRQSCRSNHIRVVHFEGLHAAAGAKGIYMALCQHGAQPGGKLAATVEVVKQRPAA